MSDTIQGAVLSTGNDPLLDLQWHLKGPEANGANVEAVWADYTGKGIKIAIHDDGIQLDHPDLAPNVDRSLSIYAVTGEAVPNYVPSSVDNHGTGVAGVAAAAGNNGLGGRGAAYEATIVAIHDPTIAGVPTLAAIVNARNHAAAHADIINGSWGYADGLDNGVLRDNFDDPYFAPARDATINAADNGRGGLGTIIVMAGGNGRADDDNANYHSFDNNRYTITVAAVADDGKTSWYSSPGASILVATPSSGLTGTNDRIVTTDRTGDDGYGAGDYQGVDGVRGFGGTSSAAPLVSGIVALILEANGSLGWRDVQEILAISARQSDPNEAIQINGAGTWNGGGYTVSHDFGFGVVDALAAVRLAETWGAAHTSANEVTVEKTVTLGAAGAIADDPAAPLVSTAVISQGIDIDRVEVTVKLNHAEMGDLKIELVSPDGTSSLLLDTPTTAADFITNLTFTFGSTLLRGETGQGTWTLRVTDTDGNDKTGLLDSWTLKLYGDALSADDTYYYTNDFAHLTDASRLTLSDTDGGSDTINAAALSAASEIDLAIGRASLAGKAVTFAAGSIENAFGGDQADRLLGSAAANQLHGGRGGDSLIGRGGNDALYGDNGNDSLRGGAGADILHGGAGIDLASYLDSAAGVTINLANGTALGGDAQGDLLVSIENLSGSDGNDSLAGSAGTNTLFGRDGNDVLNGGGGKDNLQGNAGADRFVFSSALDSGIGSNADRIGDFSHSQSDLIDLRLIDANTAAGGDQAFTFIGTGLYTHTAGELRFAVNAGGNAVTLAGDIDGDGVSNFQIVLGGIAGLIAADILL
ncbi:S8 family serine peptidase [Inquilinus sp. CA228]|uniref:S8 family serine peptidase n=1 Tax=Inquilinus sp. CA228 TaxID=3455609 RepID=UPI003F8CFD28